MTTETTQTTTETAAPPEASAAPEQFPRLKAMIHAQAEADFKREMERLNAPEDAPDEGGVKRLVLFYGKTYKGTPEQVRAKWVKFLTTKSEKREAAEMAELNAAAAAPDFSRLIVTLDWSPSRVWRSNPRASTNYGFTGSCISGCGYDKQSTALAEGLNSHAPLMRLLYAAKERGEKLPYGAAADRVNSPLPHFEGGVGYSAHRQIVEALGLQFEAHEAKNADVFIISRKEASV